MKRMVAQTQWTVNSENMLYNAKGEVVGYKVIEMEAFTKEELASSQCTECGGPNGYHREYFIKTGQCGAGSVEGYYKMCSRKGK
jgi:hypothetical protein